MAKAKVLADRICITSEVLTDENIEKVRILAPSNLVLFDEKKEDKVLFEVTRSDYNTFTEYGACVKEGKTLDAKTEKVLSLDKDKKKKKIKTMLTAVLTRINAVEAQVENYLEVAEDLSEDVEFLD